MSNRYKIRGGENIYDDFIIAVKIAEAKAEDEEEPVTIMKKENSSFKPDVKIKPDGSQKKIEK